MQQDVTGMKDEREVSERMVGHCRSKLELLRFLPSIGRVSCNTMSNVLCQVKTRRATEVTVRCCLEVLRFSEVKVTD